ncbi:MAG TPA: 50S ribosomal protein L32 [Candidatus Dormibacteraeota bacterium]
MSQGGQVPKSKLSKGRRDRRRGSNWKPSVIMLVRCPRCSQPTTQHTVCRNCGHYRGREVLKTQ